MKKIISLVLTLVLAVTMLPAWQAAEAPAAEAKKEKRRLRSSLSRQIPYLLRLSLRMTMAISSESTSTFSLQ